MKMLGWSIGWSIIEDKKRAGFSSSSLYKLFYSKNLSSNFNLADSSWIPYPNPDLFEDAPSD
jgi:hypothetical protein